MKYNMSTTEASEKEESIKYGAGPVEQVPLGHNTWHVSARIHQRTLINTCVKYDIGTAHVVTSHSYTDVTSQWQMKQEDNMEITVLLYNRGVTVMTL